MDFFEVTAFAEGETGDTTAETTETTADSSTSGASSGTTSNWGSMLQLFLPIVLIIALMYFMLIRPQRKKEKETKAMIDAMKVGDKVVTIGGICGKVVKIKDQYVFIESGNIGTENEKSVIKMERDAVKTVEQKLKN